MGPLTPQERSRIKSASPISGQYDETVDRQSAFEMLEKRAAEAQAAEEEAERLDEERERSRSGWTLPDFGGRPDDEDDDYRRDRRRRGSSRARSNRQSVAEAAIKSVVRSVGSSLGRALVRGILGSLKKGF